MPECQTRVDLFPEVRDGTLHFYADVNVRQSPTVAAFLASSSRRSTASRPRRCSAIPADFVRQVMDGIGLAGREAGLNAMLAPVKRHAADRARERWRTDRDQARHDRYAAELRPTTGASFPLYHLVALPMLIANFAITSSARSVSPRSRLLAGRRRRRPSRRSSPCARRRWSCRIASSRSSAAPARSGPSAELRQRIPELDISSWSGCALRVTRSCLASSSAASRRASGPPTR